ncbi:NHS-like protein 1 isoform X2 [Tachysurus ichikawai]
MIAYLDCTSHRPEGKCWNRTCYEDEDELLPLYISKPNNLHPNNLRRRPLTAKIHHQQDRLWQSRYWDGTRVLKSMQPLKTQNSSTFKPMQEDISDVLVVLQWLR